jgi:hypothetical protein
MRYFLDHASMEMNRQEGLFETLNQIAHDNYGGSGTIVTVAKIRETLNPALLSIALQKVQNEQPLLRATVKKTKDAYFFAIDKQPDYLPLFNNENAVQPAWQVIAESEYHFHFEHSAYQWHLRFIVDNSASILILTAAHNIADGISVAHFFHRLLKHYADENLPLFTFELLPAVESLLTRYQRGEYSPPVDFAKTPFCYNQSVPIGSRQVRNSYHTLSTAQTQKIIDFTKQNKITVNELFNAALLIGLAKFRDQEINITTHTPVNLRSLCQPSVIPDYFGCYISVLTCYHSRLSPDDELVKLAKAYRHLLAAQLSLNQMILPDKFSKTDLKKAIEGWIGNTPLQQFPGGVMVSNIGALPFESDYNGIHWDELYFGTSRQGGDFIMLLNVLTLSEQVMLCFNYADPLLRPDEANIIIHYFLELISC